MLQLYNLLRIKIGFRSISEAENAFKEGIVWGIIHFGKDFSERLITRAIANKNADLETITGSRITVNLDWSSKNVIFKNPTIISLSVYDNIFVMLCLYIYLRYLNFNHVPI